MLEFFDAVQRAFAHNRESSERFAWFLAGLTALAVAWLGVAVVRQRRQRALLVDDFLEQRGLPEEEGRFARTLAHAAHVEPMELLTHLDVFEHATAAALTGAVRVGETGETLATHVHRLREALHFDRLPTHAPLVSTRELRPGTALRLPDGRQVQISELDELRFAIESAPGELNIGDHVSLELRHAREAVYRLDCRLVEASPTQLFFAHDEAPQRVQQREYARAEHHAPVTLSVHSRVGHALPSVEVSGELRDISGGGALVVTRRPLPPGTVVTLSPFRLAGETFQGLRAVVLGSEVRAGQPHLHLEFRITERQRDHLVAAVTRLSGRGEAS